MLGENLKALRKQRGMSKEVMKARQLMLFVRRFQNGNKGLSVPDAQMLTRIAELFEVPVSSLLGEKIERKGGYGRDCRAAAVLNERACGKDKAKQKDIQNSAGCICKLSSYMRRLEGATGPGKRITGAGDEKEPLQPLTAGLTDRGIYTVSYTKKTATL